MKIIKLFLLFSLGLWAEFKLDIPNEINSEQLEYIIEHGWNEQNETLNTFIIKYGEKVLPEAMERIKEPLVKVEPTEENMFPSPKAFLAKDDVMFIVAYTKFLEVQGNIGKSIDINLKILEGVYSVEDESLLSVMFRMVFGDIVIKAIKQSIEDKVYTFEKMVYLHNQMKTFVILDTKSFFTAMMLEKKSLSDLSSNALLKQRYVEEQVGKSYKYLMEDVNKKVGELSNIFYKKMFTAMKKATPESMKQYDDEIQKDKEIYLSTRSSIRFFFSASFARVKSIFGIEVRDFGYMSEHMAGAIVGAATPRISGLYLEYLKHIENNQNFLIDFEKNLLSHNK